MCLFHTHTDTLSKVVFVGFSLELHSTYRADIVLITNCTSHTGCCYGNKSEAHHSINRRRSVSNHQQSGAPGREDGMSCLNTKSSPSFLLLLLLVLKSYISISSLIFLIWISFGRNLQNSPKESNYAADKAGRRYLSVVTVFSFRPRTGRSISKFKRLTERERERERER